MGKIILLTGGARSGKSDYAQKRAEQLPGKHFFLATCPAVDREMDDRIKRHQADRANGLWQTLEEEIDIALALYTLPADSVCLLDCLTLWVNNLMYKAENVAKEFNEDTMTNYVELLLASADKYKGTLICVSNEVGMGVVPNNLTARKYRDCVGRCNRQIAKAADEVILVSCGLPLFLKGAPQG